MSSHAYVCMYILLLLLRPIVLLARDTTTKPGSKPLHNSTAAQLASCYILRSSSNSSSISARSTSAAYEHGSDLDLKHDWLAACMDSSNNIELLGNEQQLTRLLLFFLLLRDVVCLSVHSAELSRFHIYKFMLFVASCKFSYNLGMGLGFIICLCECAYPAVTSKNFGKTGGKHSSWV